MSEGGLLIPHAYVPNREQLSPGQLGTRCLVDGCGQPEAHTNHSKEAEKVVVTPAKSDWVGDTPFWLMCQTDTESGNVGIDLDENGWIEKNKALMRSPGTWFLMAKRTGKPVFSVVMDEGDQFYYTKRHVGDLMRGKEVVCYGIGKKKADGTPVNLWLLPNGMVCGGDDADVLAARMI